MTNKEWRKTIYQWLASENFIFNRERHQMLKKLLNAREQPDDDFLDNLDEDLETDDLI